MKKLRQGLGIATVILVAVIVAGSIQRHRDLDRIESKIREHRDRLVVISGEERALQQTIKAIGEDMAQLPDSLKAGKTGRVVKRSWEIGKRQDILNAEEGRRRRAMARLRKEQRRKEASYRKWGMAIGGVTLVSFLGFLGLARIGR